MEYIRTADGQIQVDFCRRVGQLLLQYEKFSGGLPQEQRYESTLTLCLLQALLTNTVEKMRSDPKKKNEWGKLANRLISEEPALLGLEPHCVEETWPPNRALRYRDIIECLRNALSHPLVQGETKHPVTGYISYLSSELPSGDIQAYRFTQSPWINKKGSDVLPTYQVKEAEQSKLEEIMQKAVSDYQPKSPLLIQRRTDGKLQIFHDGQPFVPVLRLFVTVQQLRTLTLALGERLSECLKPWQSQEKLTASARALP